MSLEQTSTTTIMNSALLLLILLLITTTILPETFHGVQGFSSLQHIHMNQIPRSIMLEKNILFIKAKDTSFEEAAFHLHKDDNNDKINDLHPNNNNDDNMLPTKIFYKSSKLQNATLIQNENKNDSNDDTNPQSIQSTLKPLIRMMRPGNFPGVILFHLIGIHKSLSILFNNHQTMYSTSLFIKVVSQPTLIATLFTLLLIVSTSMIVNDYYDSRSGVDYMKAIKNKRSPFQEKKSSNDEKIITKTNHNNDNNVVSTTSSNTSMKPLATGEVSLQTAKQFLSLLYGTLLITINTLPGIPTRLLAMGGSILTFYYTKHIKPKTWMKNVSCSILMSLAPLTSGYATVCHPFVQESVRTIGSSDIDFWMIWKGLGPLFCSLFFGFMGREIVMDITDYEADKSAGINTVPVVNGKRMASKVVMLQWLASGMFISISPIIEIYSKLICVGSFPTFHLIRKLSLALTGSAWIITRGIQIFLKEGNDNKLLERAIEETKLSMLLLLASCV